MNRTGKEMNLTGNNIINLGYPRDVQDASTKGYVDRTVERVTWRIHTQTPLSNLDEYIRTINNKEITMANLAGICQITTNWTLNNGAHSYWEENMARIWLESSCCPKSTWLPKQDLAKKYITVEYQFPVNINWWCFLLRYDEFKAMDIKFQWQVSVNGEKWHALSKTFTAILREKKWNGNTHELHFHQDGIPGVFRFWRIVVVKGTVPEKNLNDPWINLLLMNINI